MVSTMTDSDSSPYEVDSSGFRVVSHRKSGVRNHGSRIQSRQQVKKQTSSSTVCNPIDWDTIIFLSSPLHVSAVTSKFDARKKKIVESIGFGGLLYLPVTNCHEKAFPLWLLRNLKWLSGCLCLGDNINLTLSAEHVGKVIGLNHTGIDVVDKALESSAEKSAFLKSRLSFLGSECDIVEAAECFVASEFPDNASPSYIDNFKVAFVIFVMGRFLAPGDHYSEGNYDFWGALDEPDAIICYNWSGYVLSNMLESARKLNWDIVYNRKMQPITCCTLILQIFYLDNIDFGTYNRAHNVFPRVKDFCSEVIAKMIETDRCKNDDPSCIPSFGAIQMIRSSNTCYNLANTAGTPAVPAGFSPSPPMYPPPRSASPKQSMKRNIDQTSSANPSSSGTGLQLPIDNSHLAGSDIVDIPSFLREHYNGQCPPELLQAISMHQAKCFHHVETFTKSLKAAISKENANFALRLTQQCKLPSVTLVAGQKHSPLPVRRIQYNDSPLSTGHPDNHKLKMPRYENIQAWQTTKESPANSGASSGKDCTPHSDPSSNLAKTSKTSSLQKHTQGSSRSGFLGGVIKVDESPKSNLNYHSPEPSCQKLLGTPQQFSPTTENKISNGISLSARQITSMKSIDLNARSFAAEYSSSPTHKKKAEVGPFALSHWSLGLAAMSPAPSTCTGFYNWLSTTPKKAELDRLWIRHDSPRFIQISGHQLRTEFVCNIPTSFAVFDLVVRRMKQVDRSIYSSTRPLRWRHLLESDFSIHALGDDHPHENVSVRDQFIGDDVDYELCRCCMIYVPVSSNDLWWAYAFDMKSNSVVIMDPSCGDEMNDILIRRHAGTIDAIKHHLTVTIGTFFAGWSPTFEHFKTVVLRTAGMPCRRYQSGFFTLFLIANFDGASLISEPSQVNVQKFKELLLYETLDLEGNSATTPSPYIHVID